MGVRQHGEMPDRDDHGHGRKGRWDGVVGPCVPGIYTSATLWRRHCFLSHFLHECHAASDRAADAAAAIYAVEEYVAGLLTCAVSMGAVMGSLVGATIGFIGGGFQILRYV